MSLAAGRLTKRVEIDARTHADAGDTWSYLASVWAEIKPVRGTERFQNGETESDVTHTITMRNHLDLTPSHRIRFGTRTFEIRAVVNVSEMGEYLEVDAAEVL